MLVGAAEEWFLAPGEQLVPLNVVMSPSSARGVQLWDDNTPQTFRTDVIEKAATSVGADLTKRSTTGFGYVVTVPPHSLDRVSALMYRTWSEWTWDNEPAWSPSDVEDPMQR